MRYGFPTINILGGSTDRLMIPGRTKMYSVSVSSCLFLKFLYLQTCQQANVPPSLPPYAPPPPISMHRIEDQDEKEPRKRERKRALSNCLGDRVLTG